MSNQKKHPNHSPDRRAQFEASPPRRGGVSPTALMVALSLVFGGVLVYLIASGRQAGPPEGPVMEIAGAGADVTLPVATFADGAARFYRYTTAAGREIRFFVMKSSDGVVRAAFDACDTCYRDRLGYHQQGDVMVCNNCGRTFRSVDINVLQGGCNPAPLERTVVGDQVVLRAGSIALGTTYF
jgi:uncharacterized membrane protein